MLETGERLEECRKRMGLTFRQLVDQTGLSQGLLNGTHTGDYKLTLQTAKTLAAFYRTTPEWLLDGNPNVSIWREFQQLPDFTELSLPTTSRTQRVAAVIRYVEEHFPRHMRREDLAKYMHTELAAIERILTGHSPSKIVVESLATLTGVESSWMELGSFSPLAGYPEISTLDRDTLLRWLRLACYAADVGIPVSDVELIVHTMGRTQTQKGGSN